MGVPVAREEIRLHIEEWFADQYSYEGISGAARVYAAILQEAERQLEYFSEQVKPKEDIDG